MKKYIYLAGPIAGCDKGEANDWRNDIKSRLIDGIVGISPLRCEPKIKEKYKLSYAEDTRFGTPAAISGKNKLDTISCDLLLAYLPREINKRRPSYGTVWELGWASEMGKPIILVTDDPYVAKHPLFTENIAWIVDNFDDALDIIHGLFGDYVTEPKINYRVSPGQVVKIMPNQSFIQDEI